MNCPYCGSEIVAELMNKGVFQCVDCGRRFKAEEAEKITGNGDPPRTAAKMDMVKTAAAHPDDTRAKRDLALSYEREADKKNAAADFDDALELYQKSAEIYKRLAAEYSDDTQVQHLLSIIYNKIGCIFEVWNEIGDASTCFHKSLEIVKRLAGAS